MFSQLFVSHAVTGVGGHALSQEWRGVGMSGTPQEGTPLEGNPRKVHPPLLTSSGGQRRGWYASYWNAFLFKVNLF